MRQCGGLKEDLKSRLDYTIIRPTAIYGNARDHNIRLVHVVSGFPSSGDQRQGGYNLSTPKTSRR